MNKRLETEIRDIVEAAEAVLGRDWVKKNPSVAVEIIKLAAEHTHSYLQGANRNGQQNGR